MRRYVLLPPLAALTICAFTGIAAVAAPGESSGPPGMERMQHWAADHEVGMDMMGRENGMMGQGGMGMMSREPGRMNWMGCQSDDEQDNSDDR